MVADDVAGREVDPSPDPGHDLAPAADPGGDPGAKGAIGPCLQGLRLSLSPSQDRDQGLNLGQLVGQGPDQNRTTRRTEEGPEVRVDREDGIGQTMKTMTDDSVVAGHHCGFIYFAHGLECTKVMRVVL